MTGRIICPSATAAVRMYHLPMKPTVPGKPSSESMQTLSPKAMPGRVGGEPGDVVVGDVPLAAPAERGEEAEARERGETVRQEVEQHRARAAAAVPVQTATSM